MPTENRSSNTEMVSLSRDLIDLTLAHLPNDSAAKWELHEVLAQPSPQPHPEPIAWMVGTAIWWTKEEAERDAAETGLPIVGLGPMSAIAPAEQHQGEQHQGELVARVEVGADRNTCAMIIDQEWLRQLKDKAEHLVVHLYTHADPGEVERLRAACEKEFNDVQQLSDEVQKLRKENERLRLNISEMNDEARIRDAQLAERDALLVDIRLSGLNDERSSRIDSILSSGAYADAINKHPSLRTCLDNAAIDAALSASAEPSACEHDWVDARNEHVLSGELCSKCHAIRAGNSAAEPSAPKCVPEKPSRCTSCDNCQGFNTGHDSTQQKPYSIRCDNCHKEARAADHTGLARAWNALNQGE